MPYRVRNAKDDTANRWVTKHLSDDLGLDEGWKGALAGGLAGAALGSMAPGFGTVAGGLAGAYAGHKLGDEGFADPDKEWKSPQKPQPQQQKPVSEGSCNMTMEGEYCPEHGLAECGMSSGGAMGMPYSMGEAEVQDDPQDDAVPVLPLNMVEEKDDPINYNAAMTGSYYEGKETRTQEGDALLARIKSLALLR
jgi:hypothetical protein